MEGDRQKELEGRPTVAEAAASGRRLQERSSGGRREGGTKARAAMRSVAMANAQHKRGWGDLTVKQQQQIHLRLDADILHHTRMRFQARASPSGVGAVERRRPQIFRAKTSPPALGVPSSKAETSRTKAHPHPSAGSLNLQAVSRLPRLWAAEESVRSVGCGSFAWHPIQGAAFGDEHPFFLFLFTSRDHRRPHAPCLSFGRLPGRVGK
jgi:uncharacterized protein (DUF4415 family)